MLQLLIDRQSVQCGHRFEDELHFFFTCPLYQRQRAALHEKVLMYAPFNLFTILHGNPNASIEINEIIVNTVHDYIDSTTRFSRLFIEFVYQ